MSRRGGRIWPLLALPGTAWLAAFFLVAFYAIVCVGLGNVTELYQPVPHWNPLDWNVGYLWQAFTDVLPGGRTWDVFFRTLVYVVVAPSRDAHRPTGHRRGREPGRAGIPKMGESRVATHPAEDW